MKVEQYHSNNPLNCKDENLLYLGLFYIGLVQVFTQVFVLVWFRFLLRSRRFGSWTGLDKLGSKTHKMYFKAAMLMILLYNG